MASSKTYPQQSVTLGYLLLNPYRKHSDRIYGRLADRGYTDVRPSHGAVLRNIGSEGNRLTELAERAQMTKQSMAYLVDHLQLSGYLKYAPDPHDGRAKLVQLTSSGKRLVKTLLKISRDVEAEIANKLGTRYLQQLQANLKKLDTFFDT